MRLWNTLAVIFVGIALLSSAPLAQADDVYQVIIKKQEAKKRTRWTLSEWLETRDRMRLMDLWLAMHSPSPYEFFLGGDLNFAESSYGPNTQSGRVYLAGYASIFGLEVNRSFTPDNEWLGIFNLRVFGFHAQGTNITFQGGIRSQTDPLDVRNPFAGVNMTLYLTRHFGLEGLYRHHFAGVPNSGGETLPGNHFAGGAFIDFGFWRIYGNYYGEQDQLQVGESSSARSQKGVLAGTRLFF